MEIVITHVVTVVLEMEYVPTLHYVVPVMVIVVKRPNTVPKMLVVTVREEMVIVPIHICVVRPADIVVQHPNIVVKYIYINIYTFEKGSRQNRLFDNVILAATFMLLHCIA